MEKRMTSRQKQAFETREKVYEAAMELFAREPYDDVKIVDICEKAGVSVGTFYHYFKTKEHVLSIGFHVFDHRMEQELENNPIDHPIDAIRQVLRRHFQSTGKRGIYAVSRLYVNHISGSERPALDRDYYINRYLKEKSRQAVEQGLLQGDAETIYRELVCIVRGSVYSWCFFRGDFDLEKYGMQMLDIYLASKTKPAD